MDSSYSHASNNSLDTEELQLDLASGAGGDNVELTSQERVVTPWKPDLELVLDDHLGPGHRTSSQVSSTVLIKDRGNSDYLACETEQQKVPGSISTDLHGIGSNPSLSLSSPRKETPPPAQLGPLLRRARVKSTISRRLTFIPLNELGGIITDERVQSELKKHSLKPCSELARQILDIKIIEKDLAVVSETKNRQDRKDNQELKATQDTRTSRRKLFAILVLINKSQYITAVIEEGLYDYHLPFELDDDQNGEPVLARRVDGKLEKLEFCSSWLTVHHESFERYQWDLQAPYFKLRKDGKRDGKRHHELQSGDVLPFIECTEVEHPSGQSEVFKVRIHPGHHNVTLSSSAGQEKNPYFALKCPSRIKKDDFFQGEFKILDRLAYKQSPHLTGSMGTFEQDDRFFILFPWADGGNLQDLWRSNPENPNGARDWIMGRWFAEQILGLANGLADIHKCDLGELHLASMRPSEIGRKYGIHGDVKPENILWFKEAGVDLTKDPHGVLKISDFGFSTFNGSEAPKAVRAKGFTPSYRSPEFEKHEKISQNSDIWAFGCVLIEFLTWYLEGMPGVRNFEGCREKESYPGIRDKAFFEIITLDECGIAERTKKKASVLEHLQRLSALRYCPDFILDLIHYVKSHLFHAKPAERTPMNRLVPVLEDWRDKCNRDEAFVTERGISLLSNEARADTTASDKSELNLRFHRDIEEDFVPRDLARTGKLPSIDATLSSNHSRRFPRKQGSGDQSMLENLSRRQIERQSRGTPPASSLQARRDYFDNDSRNQSLLAQPGQA